MKWTVIYALFLIGLISIFFTGRKVPRFQGREVSAVHDPNGIFAPGRVEGNTSEIELYASIREIVAATPVREGDFVRTGELIIQLDDRIYAAEVELATAGVQLAQAELQRLRNGAIQSEIDEARQQCELRRSELQLATRVRDRGLLLAPTQSISQHELDENEANASSTLALLEAAQAKLATIAAPPRNEDVHIAEAKLASARARLRMAQAALSRTQIRAPRDGMVLKINVEVGELETDKPLAIISDTHSLYVRGSVDEFDALRVSVGQSVTMTTNAMPGRILRGEISRISPKMDHKEIVSERLDTKLDTRAREIWVEVEKDSPLIVGLPMELWIAETPRASIVSRGTRTAGKKTSKDGGVR